MAVFRVERTKDYTVMCNCHLRDQNLSLKAKGLLSMMLSLPDDWNFTTKGLATICKEGTEAIGTGLKELEKAGYIVRHLLRGDHGRITDTEYIIYERPQSGFCACSRLCCAWSRPPWPLTAERGVPDAGCDVSLRRPGQRP